MGEVAFFVFYASFYKEYGWLSPDLPGGIFAAVLFGWPVAWIVMLAGELTKDAFDHLWPVRPKSPKPQ
ncbi:MAG TPA: hypothetical protein VF773_21325 [Verrucomicrobiae bacterium]